MQSSAKFYTRIRGNVVRMFLIFFVSAIYKISTFRKVNKSDGQNGCVLYSVLGEKTSGYSKLNCNIN